MMALRKVTSITAGFLSVLLLFSVLAQDTPVNGGEKQPESVKTGNLSIKLNPYESAGQKAAGSKTPAIEIDSSNVRILDRKTEPDTKPKKGEIVKKIATAKDSLAAKLANESSKTIIEWRPNFNSNGARGIRIVSMDISQDRSVLVFAEKTGKESGPNGTRIIVMNTYTWEPMKVFHIDADILQVKIIPDSCKLAAFLAKQEKLQQQNAIGIIDFEQEKLEKKFSFPQEAQLADLCVSGDSVYAALKNKPEILAYKIAEQDTAVPVTMKCDEPVSALAITPNNLFLAGISAKRMTLFKLSDSKKYSAAEMELPWNPAQIQFLDSEKNYFLSPANLQDASPVLVRGDRRIPFDGRSGGYSLVTNDKKKIFIGYKVKGQIECIDSVTAEILDRTSLDQLRPPTIGNPIYVFYIDHRNFLFVLDTNGNGYVASHMTGETRWRKALIFTAKK